LTNIRKELKYVRRRTLPDYVVNGMGALKVRLITCILIEVFIQGPTGRLEWVSLREAHF
jgi:hypothetical protein